MNSEAIKCIQGYECLSASLGNCMSAVNDQLSGNAIILLGGGIRTYYDSSEMVIGSDMYDSNYVFLKNMGIDYSINQYTDEDEALDNLTSSLKSNKSMILKLGAGMLDYNRIFKQAGDSCHCINIFDVNGDECYIVDGFVPTKEPSVYTGWVSKNMIMEAWKKTSFESIVLNDLEKIKNYDYTEEIKRAFIKAIKDYMLGGNDNQIYLGKDAIDRLFSDLLVSFEKLPVEKLVYLNYQLKIYGFISQKWVLHDIMSILGIGFADEYQKIIMNWNTICSLLLKYTFGKRENKMQSLYDKVKECIQNENELLEKIVNTSCG